MQVSEQLASWVTEHPMIRSVLAIIFPVIAFPPAKEAEEVEKALAQANERLPKVDRLLGVYERRRARRIRSANKVDTNNEQGEYSSSI